MPSTTSMRRFLLPLVIASIVGATTPAISKEGGNTRRDDKIRIDGVEYKKSELIEDFINVAFSDLPWNSDMKPEDREDIHRRFFSGGYPDAYQTLKRLGVTTDAVPWMAPHIGEKLTLPLNKRNVLSRWETEDITIGIDWPRYVPGEEGQKRYEYYARKRNYSTQYSIENAANYYPRFIKAIKDQLELLSQVTGKTIRLIEPSDIQDGSEGYARLRIIPSYVRDRRVANPGPGYRFHPQIFESTLFNGILFESFTSTYFDGYLLPRQNYVVDMAVCKVDPSLDDALFIALVNECMVRSLGLPSISASERSLLSLWHTKDESPLGMSMYAFKSGRDIYESKIYRGDDERLEAEGKLHEAERRRRGKVWIVIPKKTLLAFGGLPAYDQALLRLLYCPDIKSGMSVEQVEEVLNKDSRCFEGLNSIKQ